VAIGFGAGKGVTILSGHKRHLNLQIMAVVTSVLGFACAKYLVNRTVFMRAVAEHGESLVLPLLPDAQRFYNVASAGFDLMDIAFLAFMIYEAWKIPAPIAIARAS